MKKTVALFLCVIMTISLCVSGVFASGAGGVVIGDGGISGRPGIGNTPESSGGGSARPEGGESTPDDSPVDSASAQELAQLINDMQDGACSVSENVVFLEDDLILEETLVIPVSENVVFDIDRYDVIASGDFEAVYIPDDASLTLNGRGRIIGGTGEENGRCAINNDGTLIVDDFLIEIIGGGTIDEEHSSGSGGGTSSGLGGGASSGSGGEHRPPLSINGGTPGEYSQYATEVPGTVFAQTGGAAIYNNGKLYLQSGKVVGGFGSLENGPAIQGNITGGECIVHSDDDQTYELINSYSTNKQYVFSREATSAEEFYIALVLDEPNCCRYEYSYDEETEEYTERITLLSEIDIASYGGHFVGGVELNTNGHTLTVNSDEEDENGYLYFYYIKIFGGGTINGNICFGNAVIESGTINGDLVADSLGMVKLIINRGIINGNIYTLGGILEINGGAVNGLIEALHTDVVVNDGLISGGTNSWLYEIGDSLGSVYHEGELVWRLLYDGNLGTIWIREGDITVNGGEITGWVGNDGQTGRPAISYTEGYGEATAVHLIFNGGTITGGIGTESNGRAVCGNIGKNDGVIIKESNDETYWEVLSEETTDKTYLKAGTSRCLSVKNGKAYKSNDLNTPIMEAFAGENITIIADNAPSEKLFKEWNVAGVDVINPEEETITFVMPDSNISCEAVYMNENWYQVVSGELSAVMDGEECVLSVSPVSYNGKLFALSRDIADGVGLQCQWNSESQEISFSLDNKELTIPLDSAYCMSTDDGIVVDVKKVMDMFLSDEYWVLGNENKVVAKKKTDENTVTISLSSQTGRTTGAGDYFKGSSVEINVTMNSGYNFLGWYDGETLVSSNANYVFVADSDKSLVAKSYRYSSGGGIPVILHNPGIKNEDGSITKITKDSKTGNEIKTTTMPDGSTKVEETAKDGTVKITNTDKDGNVETTINYPDGARTTERKNKNGVRVKAVTTVNNSTSATVTGIKEKTEVVVPLKNVSGKMVAVVVSEDGEETIVKNSFPTDEGMAVLLDENATLKIVDRAKDFADTKQHWAEDSIDFVVSRDLYKGVSENEFSPNTNMTRGMFAVVLHNYENNPEFEKDGLFNDVSQKLWYGEAVNWLHDKGVISGYENGEFRADENITREQLITLFYRYAGNPQYSNKNIEFNDATDISEYAKDAILWAVEKGIINGKEGNVLDPLGTATRAECAAIVQRFIKKVKLTSI